MMKLRLKSVSNAGLTALAFLLAATPVSAQTRTSCPSPAALTTGFSSPMAHIRYLADDALMGREVGTQGAWCAAEYIAAHFDDLNLVPIGPGDTYFQPFPVRAGTLLG